MGSCEFPIFICRSKFHSASAKRIPNRGSGLIKIKDIPMRAQKIIEELQPYHSVDAHTHPLWLLHRLCNIDKHRRLQLIGVPIGRISTVQDGTYKISNVKLNTKHPLRNGAVILNAVISPRSNFQKVRVEQDVPPQVTFEEDIALPKRYAGEILVEILTFIKQSVLLPLRPLLP
ncbi:hypothetical protein ACFLV0_05230 [Chloroflexota bacterium]